MQWALTLLVGLGLASFVASVAVTDLPPSPARQVLEPFAAAVVDPLFNQTWTLFAPTPPVVNESFVLMVRYRRGSRVAAPRPIDITALFRHLAEQTRWAPSRLYRVTMALAVELNRALAAIFRGRTPPGAALPGTGATAPALADQVAAAQDYYAASVLGTVPALSRTGGVGLAEVVLVELQRLLSATARAVEPDPGAIAAVRGVYLVTPIPPYTERWRRLRAETVLQTAWLPYLRSVPS